MINKPVSHGPLHLCTQLHPHDPFVVNTSDRIEIISSTIVGTWLRVDTFHITPSVPSLANRKSPQIAQSSLPKVLCPLLQEFSLAPYEYTHVCRDDLAPAMKSIVSCNLFAWFTQCFVDPSTPSAVNVAASLSNSCNYGSTQRESARCY